MSARRDLTVERMLARLAVELEGSARALKQSVETLTVREDSAAARERIVAELRDTAGRARVALELFLDRRGM